MKKLVNTPISNTIWWATVDEKKGIITGNREDVTDNAIDVIVQHITGMEGYAEKGFAGYDFKKINSDGDIRLCVYDTEKYELVPKTKQAEN